MTPFTQVVPHPAGKRVPVMVEVPLAPELDGPFLISSTSDLWWVENKFPSGEVRAAVRKIPLEFLYRDALKKIAREADSRQWGSLQRPNPVGVAAAIRHLEDYGLHQLEVLYGEGFPQHLLPGELSTTVVSWVPRGWAVVVPVDRGFVGTALDFGGGRVALVVHNASRGVAVIAPEPTPLSVLELPRRILSLLETRVSSVEELREMPASELIRISGFGKVFLSKVQEALAVLEGNPT